ncbi:replication factor A protein 3 [Aulographum hederae CBS 113979]|uniref:Replication factor A protein 3 n=1 Tax=Aulographum hederae CBS 113979 TaxID=1176131 RepID=A0A6G1GSJ4_9PEZI|nr:replication factor A protein 3 [Aulographum hederae CBS 113979]
MNLATPRITASFLDQFAHQTVRILGKVTELRGDQATVDAGGAISVVLNREAHLQLNHGVEIVGKVQNDLSIKCLVALDWGPAAAITLVEFTHRYREIFYGES